jgi:hypothetical protein
LRREAEDWRRRPITYWGLAGGLWASSSFALLAAVLASNQDHNWLPWTLFYAAMALAFLPAVIFSVIAFPRRSAVLRIECAFSLALAFASLVYLDPALFVLLSPATFMLALGAGLIWSRSKKT